MTAPARMGFAARLRLLRNKRYEDWWHIVFGGPLGVLLAALVAEVSWITPNRVTVFGFVLRLTGAGLVVVSESWADLVAVALLELSLILDITDGSLARYRKRPSALGAFLDKITDGASLAALGLLLGYRVHLDGHSALYVVAGGFIGASYLLRCYMYWVVAYLERERAAPPTVAVTRPFGELGFGERLRYYLAQSWRIVMFGEGDVYFWVGLGLLFGRLREALLLLTATMGVWLLLLAGKRIATVMRLDRAAAAARDQAA